jgi:hypothetical protein
MRLRRAKKRCPNCGRVKRGQNWYCDDCWASKSIPISQRVTPWDGIR